MRTRGVVARRRDRRRMGLFVVTAFAVLLGSRLPAFEVLGKWSIPRLSFVFNPNFPDQSSAGTPEEQIEIILCAARTWESQNRAGFELRYLGTTAIDRVSDDGVNALFWADRDGKGALAATLLDLDVVSNTIQGFDIIFYSRTNSSPIEWSGPGEPPFSAFDIGGIATHELGHAVGLAHSTVPSATMFAAASNRGLSLRSLDPDDREGIEFLYGNAAPFPSVEMTGIEPRSGPPAGGNEVVITGSNFTYDSDTALRIDGFVVDRSRWTVESCDRIRVTNMPPHVSGPVDITVVNSVGASRLAGGYRYGAPGPSILSIEPDRGPLEGGITVTIRGDRLTEDAVVEIDGRPIEDVLFVDAETIVGTVPSGSHSGPVDVRLTQGPDTFVLEGGFFYNGYRLEVGDAAAPPASIGVPVSVLSSSPDPLGAVSFGLLFDPALVNLSDITAEGTVSEAAEFSRANIDNESGVATFGIVMSFSGDREIPAGDRQLIGRVLANTDPSAPVGSTASLDLAGDVGSPPIRLIFTPAGTSDEITPHTENGAIQITEGVPFLRGDANDDGSVNISDATAALETLFQAGAASRCQKALDANDDGTFNISDAVYLLNFLFASGDPIPPPYPDAGLDPTPDTLPCG